MALYQFKYKLTKTGKLDTHEDSIKHAKNRILNALAIAHGENIKVTFSSAAKADYSKPGKIRWKRMRK